MNYKHSYIRDMYSSAEVDNMEKASFVNDINWKKRTVNGIKYRDPDYNCDRLYNDVNEVFFKGNLKKDFDVYDKKQLVLLQDGIRLTTDYIGPSLTSMKRAGIPDSETWDCILKCRTIGGHLVWPRVKYGINPSKAFSGSRGYGISDRIDIALYEIKCVLDGKMEMPVYNTILRKRITEIEENKKWFEGKTFKDFCKDFYLTGSFVDEHTEIIWFADPILGKINERTMRLYMENNINAINKRNRFICDLKKMGAKS